MARWDLQIPAGMTTETYYGQLYENYAQMLKNQGISGEQFTIRLGNYAEALQQKLLLEPGKLQDGRIIATDPKGYGYTSNAHAVKNPNTLSAELEAATQKLNNAQAMFQHQGMNPLTRTILPFSGPIEDIYQQFAHAQQAQYYPITEKGVTKYCIKTPDGKVQVFDTEKAMKHAKKQMQKSGVAFESKPNVPQNATFTNPAGTARNFVAEANEAAANRAAKPIIEQPVIEQPIEQSPSLAGRTVQDIQAQQRALYIEEQGTPKVEMRRIKEGPNKGKFGVFVNDELQENQVFDSKNKASKARIEIENTLSDPVKRAVMAEADAMEALAREQAEAITPKQKAQLFAETEEAGARTTVETATEAGAEAGTRTTVETATEAGAEAGARTTVETATEAGARAGAETAAEAGAEAGARAGAETAAETGAKAGGKSLFRQHGGKILIAGLVLAGAAALFGLSKCSDDKKQQLPPVEPDKKPDVKPETKPEAKSETTEAKSEATEVKSEATEVKSEATEVKSETTQQNENIQAVKGSHEYGYAELELIAEHLGQEGYRPSNQEIIDRTMEIIERENKTIEEAKTDDKDGKNRHSVPPLKVGDDLKVSSELKTLIDQATKELKEAHKNNPNYQVTWSELKAKVKEIVARQ